MNASITVNQIADAEALWVVRDRIVFRGTFPESRLAMLEVEVPPGSGTPPHRHASAEMFRILDGEIIFGMPEASGTSETVAAAGSVVSVAPFAAHCYRNAGTRLARMLVLVDESMVAFFRDLGRREAPLEGPPSGEEIAAVMAACARHQITVFPPPAG